MTVEQIQKAWDTSSARVQALLQSSKKLGCSFCKMHCNMSPMPLASRGLEETNIIEKLQQHIKESNLDSTSKEQLNLPVWKTRKVTPSVFNILT